MGFSRSDEIILVEIHKTKDLGFLLKKLYDDISGLDISVIKKLRLLHIVDEAKGLLELNTKVRK